MKDKFINLKRGYLVLPSILILFLLSLIFTPYLLHLFIFFFMYLLLALGFNVIISYTGLWNFGYAIFFGLGAYCTALITTRLSVSPWLSILATVIVVAFVGAFIAYPAVRIKGFYYAIATLIFAEMTRLIFKHWEAVGATFGIRSIPGISIGTMKFHSIHYYYLFLISVISIIFLVHRVVTSRFGRVLRSIRENELLANSMGINVVRYRVAVNILSGATGSLAGALYAHYIGFIDPATFSLDFTVIPIAMVLIGGRGIPGSILGTSIFFFLSEYLRGLLSPAVRLALVGLMVVLVLLVMPKGIYGEKERIMSFLRAALT